MLGMFELRKKDIDEFSQTPTTPTIVESMPCKPFEWFAVLKQCKHQVRMSHVMATRKY